MDKHLVAYYIGIAIIVLSHIYMLSSSMMSESETKYHAWGNLLASAMVAYYFMSKEGFVKF